MSNTALFTSAADSFVRLLEQVRPEQWEQPGLGEWDVRSLAGHTARAILTVESYLGQDEPSDITIPSAEVYYNTVLEQFTDHSAIAERGREAGAWLGDDPVATVNSAIARTIRLVHEQPGNRIVSIGGMGILLDEYLRTRVVELIVHSIDLAAAIGVKFSPPVEPLLTTVALLSGTAVHKGYGVELVRALSGRGALPDDFTVV